ncbi:MAG: sulfide/dihydroorotate dehydrogenase-like FAD/NAD-binding protein [Bifidobacteriaceae bacterium]|jgi:glutamate synthase (NADPH/NADH) small chain|nr:sulfide/dihydroorotate dehydrogenase-like FAD/NAD-binding protein [Bifidobacteriaceae bacterium]
MSTPVDQWSRARSALSASAAEVARLESEPAVDTFNRQMSILERRLAAQPRFFRDLFMAEGVAAVATEFQGEDLSQDFTLALWARLEREGSAATLLMRFIWNLPVGKKRMFLRALDRWLSDRYPMFAGLSDDWPAGNGIEPYIRTPEARSTDFDLVNMGYLGYMAEGYTRREVELFVWLEAIRDKQCAESPCELGKFLEGARRPTGGCPVRIHIPAMFELIGQGRFDEALAMLEEANPLPNVTGRVCPQELQCQGVCLHKLPMSIGQVEWFLAERDKLAHPDQAARFAGVADPWQVANRPPVAVVGSGPSGLISAYLLAVAGFPVTVFEAFHELGGVLRYGIPEFRLPNQLIDDVVAKIRLLGGRFVTNFVVGKTATLAELQAAGFARVFVGTGAGLPRFMGIPGEHLLGVMSANEFLTRVNLMGAHLDDTETPLPLVKGKHIMVIGGGNTAMDAARTAKRLGGLVTITYRRTKAEMPARVEELEHALEEGIILAELRAPSEFVGDPETGFVRSATVDIMELGEPDASGRRRPQATGRSLTQPVDLAIMALGNAANPIIKDSEPRLKVSRWGTIDLLGEDTKETTVGGIYSGGDAARGGSTAILAAGDGQAAAREIIALYADGADDLAGAGDLAAAGLDSQALRQRVDQALAYTEAAGAAPVIVTKRGLTPGIEEFEIYSPAIAASAQAGQFVRVAVEAKGELIPLTLADWDIERHTVTLVVQDVGTTSHVMNELKAGDRLGGIAGPLGQPSKLHRYGPDQTVVFTAGGLGLPPVYPIAREQLRLGNHVTLILGFRSRDLMFWTGPDERVPRLQAEFGDQLDVIYATNDGSFGVHGFVTAPLQEMLEVGRAGTAARRIAEVVGIGPPLMMRAVADLTRGYGVPTVASLNSIMVDATGMCGACMVPVTIDGKLVRRHACIDGPEIDAHLIDWDKFLPRFGLFKAQELASRQRRGLA